MSDDISELSDLSFQAYYRLSSRIDMVFSSAYGRTPA